MSEITAKGRNGQVTFDGKVVTITREGFGGRVSHGRNRKDFPVSRVSGVQLRPNSLMSAGYFALTLPGAQEGTRKHGGGARDAVKDENAVVFGKRSQPEFEALRDAILRAL